MHNRRSMYVMKKQRFIDCKAWGAYARCGTIGNFTWKKIYRCDIKICDPDTSDYHS